MARLEVGDRAPDFDLSSTEDAVLMLRDEVPRTAVLLYFFADPASDRVRADLGALAARRQDLARAELKVMGISPAAMDELKTLQSELALPFPLLRDDRGFSRVYGLAAEADGPDKPDTAPEPALFLVNRDQTLLWVANPAAAAGGLVSDILAQLKALPSSTANYPRSVINRLVDLWVN